MHVVKQNLSDAVSKRKRRSKAFLCSIQDYELLLTRVTSHKKIADRTREEKAISKEKLLQEVEDEHVDLSSRCTAPFYRLSRE